MYWTHHEEAGLGEFGIHKIYQRQKGEQGKMQSAFCVQVRNIEDGSIELSLS